VLAAEPAAHVRGGGTPAGVRALIPASLLDPRQILGISRWIKPMKFTTMGVLIGINTLAVLYALIVFSTRPVTATPALRAGIRLGLFIFVLASLGDRLSGAVGAPRGAGVRGPAADRCRPLTSNDGSLGVMTVSSIN
jgi:hypothetical protein